MGENLKIRYNEETDKVTMSVANISKIKGKLSSTGKSYIIASSERFEAIDGLDGYTVQVMLLKSAKKPKKADKDDEPVRRKKRKSAE